MLIWLLEQTVGAQFERATAEGFTLTAEQRAEYTANYYAAQDGDTPRLLTLAGNQAEIRIAGVITKAPDLMAFLFGGGNTTYSDIIAALASADANPDVSEIILSIDSPGGTIDGLFDAIAAIRNTSKPTRAVVHNMAASAAFGLAAQADTIEAANAAARIGSVGVAASFQIYDDEVTITSTEAPDKRPDVTTDAGKAVVRKELDGLHDLFVGAIAEGRGTTAEKINADYGRGATLLAGEAVQRGMIDSIQATKLAVVSSDEPASINEPAATGDNNPEAETMDINTLRAQHPDTYAAVLQAGIDQERVRVSAHVTMAKASGDTETALDAIKSGREYDAAVQAEYMAAGMNRASLAASAADDGAAAAALDGAAAGEAPNESDQVVAMVAQSFGVQPVTA